MPLPKKYNTTLNRFVLFLTFLLILSCSTNKLYNNRIEGKNISITTEYKDNTEIENFITPYRNHINKDLDSVLAYCPETLDKSQGKWQTSIGNLMADVTFETADKLLLIRENKHLDICLLNHGGIRSIIPKGNVTTRNAYEIMPFENSLIVAALKGEQVKEIAQYMIDGKKPHPLSGMQIVIDSNNTIKSITVQGKPINDSQVYYVATSDYLFNGGDNMDFFKKAIAQYDMDYKLRNLLIDYFKEVDTLPVITSQRIVNE
ncbi:5'-nucleotidase C-terminal domain-containing protein [Flavobacterium beibuense]|uniref:5'-nucleotidase/2',3'-cyclic phosphodiesterase-like hydrolase n=1 Tax=Flavobacterium beibuense TaxID=657326 RepID=A0A444WF20_9FLAO|nr:5'-nucleotidase [Flavobacterium beibuense]RYJ44382.1 5'-nucleotidase/2',3'-cyclic phosphodiesterase-like hydrolase [Flavobacterium beibuense]